MNRSMPADQPVAESHAQYAGLRHPGAVADPEEVGQSGTDMRIVRWMPLFVTALAVALVGGTGLVVLAVL